MRASGILMPVSALPSRYGIGAADGGAERFVDFLARAGQRYWQVLPLGPTGYGDSPYQSFSVFAGNPYFIDLEKLFARGLLTREELESESSCSREDRVDYLALFEHRLPLLKKAASRLSTDDPALTAFEHENEDWLWDYALFMAIKAENGHRSFTEWLPELKNREPDALERAKARLADEIHFWCAAQFWFHEHWAWLKELAQSRGVAIIGDIPIYASQDSADLWAHPELFQTLPDGSLSEVAGCPPDGFSPDGQLWGNPLYDWDYHRRTGYDWWLRRLRHTGELCGVVRIDHFRGFAGYYSIPATDDTAKNGRWNPGPGLDFINAIKSALPKLDIIAEDLGFLTEDVRRLLADSGFPGMKVLQFAFDPGEESVYLPHKYGRKGVVYTGTHDNTTTRDWVKTAPAADVRFAKEYTGAESDETLAPALIRAAMSSACDMAVIPMADWLGLGAEGRINTPATVGENWVWRLDESALTPELAAKIRRGTKIYGRL